MWRWFRVDPDGPATIRRWLVQPMPARELRRRYGTPNHLRERAREAAHGLARQGVLLTRDVEAAVAAHCDGVEF